MVTSRSPFSQNFCFKKVFTISVLFLYYLIIITLVWGCSGICAPSCDANTP